jgi:hypothetical protein
MTGGPAARRPGFDGSRPDDDRPDDDRPDHPLITAQLARFAARLTPDLADEVADGLRATFKHHLAEAGDPNVAAAAAIAEFGDADTLVRTFETQAPGRRTATVLLVTGPLVGACWAAALITGHAWTWPIPTTAKVGFAVTLLTTMATLMALARGRIRYRRLNRGAAIAAGAVLALDAGLILTAIELTPTSSDLLLLAALASAARLALAGSRIPILLRG